MKYFKELEVGEAFKCVDSIYIKTSEKSNSNAVCLHNGHSITFVGEAGVCPVTLSYRWPGEPVLDFIISRR